MSMKRMGSLLLALIMTLSLLPMTVFADNGTEESSPVTASWKMEEVTQDHVKDQIYKLVGTVNSSNGIKTIFTSLSFDNTVIQPVDGYNKTYQNVDITNNDQNANPEAGSVKGLLKYTAGGDQSKYGQNIIYRIKGNRTSVELTQTYDSAKTTDNNTEVEYMEFYFRIKDEKTTALNESTFQFERLIDNNSLVFSVKAGGSDGATYGYFTNSADYTTNTQVTPCDKPELTYTNSTNSVAKVEFGYEENGSVQLENGNVDCTTYTVDSTYDTLQDAFDAWAKYKKYSKAYVVRLASDLYDDQTITLCDGGDAAKVVYLDLNGYTIHGDLTINNCDDKKTVTGAEYLQKVKGLVIKNTESFYYEYDSTKGYGTATAASHGSNGTITGNLTVGADLSTTIRKGVTIQGQVVSDSALTLHYDSSDYENTVVTIQGGVDARSTLSIRADSVISNTDGAAITLGESSTMTIGYNGKESIPTIKLKGTSAISDESKLPEGYALFELDDGWYEVAPAVTATFYKDAEGTEEWATVPTKTGTAPTAPTESPTKENADGYRYTFAGWAKEANATVGTTTLEAITTDASYYPVFTQTEIGAYKFVVAVEDTEKTYLVGDTITANIQAYSQKSETSNLYGFDIKLDYDNTLLSLTKLESSISGATKNVTTGAVSYGIKNGDGVGLKQNEATTLATATFTVISAGDEGTATIGLKDGTEVTEAWSSGQDTTNDAVKPEITSAEVTLKAIEVSVLPEGVSISEDEAKAAKAGQTFTFTPIVPEGSTILVATATSNEEAVPVTKGENGVYSIAESDVKGDIAITVYTASEITRDLRTIQATEEEETDTYVLYFPEGKDRVIIKTDKLESGNYALTGCDELYYSELYQGYVGFISAEQEELAFSLTDSAVTEIKHDGDVNLNGSVTSNDAVNIYNTINGKTKALAGQKMLEMDVDADGKVSVNDIQAILNLSVGLAKDYTEGES